LGKGGRKEIQKSVLGDPAMVLAGEKTPWRDGKSQEVGEGATNPQNSSGVLYGA